MNRRLAAAVAVVAIAAVVSGSQRVTATESGTEAYLSWSSDRAQTVGEQAYKRGRVGGLFDGRLLKTERAYNYKLAATLLSPAVIRASARLQQLGSRLTPEQTRKLVAEAEGSGGTTVMVEIDPREGSGVIPLDWEAFLQPEGQSQLAVRGVNTPELRNVRALAGVLRRNYDFDRFWVVFPNGADAPYARSDVQSIQLVVRIHDKEGRVEWPAALLRAQ